MDKCISYDSFMSAQNILRDRFFAIIKLKPASQYKLSKEIGISRPTIKRFLIDKLDVEFVSLCKIENYIMKKRK